MASEVLKLLTKSVLLRRSNPPILSDSAKWRFSGYYAYSILKSRCVSGVSILRSCLAILESFLSGFMSLQLCF